MTSKLIYKELKERIQVLEEELAARKTSSVTDSIANQYLEAFINNTCMPLYLKDADYNYLFINKHFGLLARVAHDQVQGKNDFDIFSEPVAQLFRAQDEEVVNRRTLLEFEETITLPDGLQTFMTAKFPLIDSEGRVYAVGGVCTDITLRKKAESELKEAEAKYRGIFEHSPLGILHINKEGIITASNEKLAQLLGIRIENILGYDLQKSLLGEKIRATIASVLSGKIAHQEGSFQFGKRGVRLYLRGVFSPIYTSDGSIGSAIGIIEDITRRMEAEEELQRAYEELEQRVADRTAEIARKSERLLEANIALKILLDKREEDKSELEKKILFNVEKLINPYIQKLKMSSDKATQEALLGIIQVNLDQITASFAHKYTKYISNLTPTQIQIADMIKQGQTTKEIASLLKLSPSTIACHRQEIRKRLSLTNTKKNLQATLTANP